MADAQHTPGYFGHFFESGEWEHTIAFRVDDPAVDGGKRIVCGCCVDADQATDSRKNRGSALCEQCGGKLGRAQAHDAAIAKTTTPGSTHHG